VVVRFWNSANCEDFTTETRRHGEQPVRLDSSAVAGISVMEVVVD
jgi:hypothetical protein